MSNPRPTPPEGTVLIVDDTPDNLRLLSQMLADQGYKTRVATNGPQALESVGVNPPDLILLDILMPEMNGYQVCERLKASENTYDIPVIFISALGATEDKVQAFAVGGVDYVTKPFQVEEVLARVETHLALQHARKQLQVKNRQLTQEIVERKQVEDALAHHAREMEALYETSLEFNTQLDISTLLNATVQRAARLLGTRGGGLFLIMPDGKTLQMAVNYNRPGGNLNVTLRLGEGMAGRVAQTGEPLMVADYDNWASRAGEKPIGVHAKRILSVPLKQGGRVVGVLNVFDDEKTGAFSRDQVQLLELFAGQAAIAIENAKLYEQAQQEISVRKQAEERIQSYSERLEEMVYARVKELEETQEKLARQEKLAILGQLAGGVGHELRNPLGVISNAVYLLQATSSEADETTKECLDIIAGRVTEAEKIVSDLLDFSRIRPADIEEIAVSALVAEVLERHPPPEGVEVTLDLGANLPHVTVDVQQMRQVLGNLITNACQAMSDQGKLTIRAQVEQDQICLSIIDTGHGISPETMEKIFEPLFTTKTKGIGLGLVVTKHLVEVNGGRMEVESTQGNGSTFTVILPAMEIV